MHLLGDWNSGKTGFERNPGLSAAISDRRVLYLVDKLARVLGTGDGCSLESQGMRSFRSPEAGSRAPETRPGNGVLLQGLAEEETGFE